jgi:hypothetical protein
MILGDLGDIEMEDGIGLKLLIGMIKISILFKDISTAVILWVH